VSLSKKCGSRNDTILSEINLRQFNFSSSFCQLSAYKSVSKHISRVKFADTIEVHREARLGIFWLTFFDSDSIHSFSCSSDSSASQLGLGIVSTISEVPMLYGERTIY